MTRAWRAVGPVLGALVLVSAAGASAAPAGGSPFGGPAVCPVAGRLGPLAAQGFTSIDLGPDRSASDPNEYHKPSVSMAGANCFVDHQPGKPNTYTCIWPVSPKAEDQFVELVESLKACVGGTLDTKMLDDFGSPDVTLTSRGVEYRAVEINSFVSLDIRPAAAGASPPSKPAAATVPPKPAAPGVATAAAPPEARAAPRRPPDWWAVGRSQTGDVTFLDVNTLAQRGPTAMAITYTVFKTPEGAVKSYLARELFYCTASKERRLNTTLFDPAGKTVNVAGLADAPVEDVRPGSYRGQVLAFACGPASARASAVQIGAMGLGALNDAATVMSR